jgi:hypothetical protein
MTPHRRIVISLVFVAACLTGIAMAPATRAQMSASPTELITNGPQTDPGDRQGARPASQNERASQNYEATVRGNPNFRAVRERKECGSIDDAKMHAECLATFAK